MTEQPGRNPADDVDIEVPGAELGDVETGDPPRQTSGESYETPDELGGTGGVDAGGAG
ncbi:MAG: hypothetical protein ABIM89_09390 [Mycobacteriales bacterium]